MPTARASGGDAPHLDIVPAAIGGLGLGVGEGAVGAELEGADAPEGGVVRVPGVLHPLADGRVDGGVDDGLIEVDDEGELALAAKAVRCLALEAVRFLCIRPQRVHK